MYSFCLYPRTGMYTLALAHHMYNRPTHEQAGSRQCVCVILKICIEAPRVTWSQQRTARLQRADYSCNYDVRHSSVSHRHQCHGSDSCCCKIGSLQGISYQDDYVRVSVRVSVVRVTVVRVSVVRVPGPDESYRTRGG